MRFQKGNRLSPGRPKGIVSTDRKRFAEVCRRMLAEDGIEALRTILRGRNPVARMRALEFVASYAIGKPLDRIAVGLDHDSPEAILLRMAGQSIPGLEDDDPVVGYLEAPEE